MMSLCLLLISLLCLLLPGMALWYTGKFGDSREKALDGICFSVAFAVCVIFLSTLVSLNFFIFLWTLLSAGSLFLLVKEAKSFTPRLGPEAISFAFILGLSGLVRFLPVYFHEYPRGWDPYFHVLLAVKITQAQTHIYDWLPFESISLNYPIGAHLSLAVLHKLTNIPHHEIFKPMLALFSTLLGAQVYSLVSNATHNRSIALYATAAYSFLAVYGSLGYYGWGGLPNLMGMYLLMGALTWLISFDEGPQRPYGLVFIFTAICFLNHHVLATTAIVIIVLILYFRKKNTKIWTLALTGLLSSPAALYYIYMKSMNSYKIADTGLLHYSEPLHTLDFISNHVGAVYLVLLLLGIFVYRTRSYQVHKTLIISNGTLLILFFIFEYGTRLINLYLSGNSLAFFTPSRFLTDAVPLLAVFTGIFLWHLQKTTAQSKIAIIALILVFSTSNYKAYTQFFTPVVPRHYRQAYQWIKENTDLDTVVLDRHIFAPLLTQRVSSNTPIPTSELWGLAQKRKTIHAIIEGKLPPQAMHCPIVMISETPHLNLPTARVVWQHPEEKLYIIELYHP